MKKTSFILGCICAGCVSIANPGYASAAELSDSALSDAATAGAIQTTSVLDGWVEENDGMHYYIEGVESISQGLRIDGKWYYFDENGVSMRNQFRQKGADIYYYDDNGWLVTDTELDISGQHYKFQSSGAAYKGWDTTSSGRYYYTGDGSRAEGEGLKIDGYWYYFKENGQMLTGWREKADGFYYYDANGHMAANKGLKIDGFWYYFSSSGRRLQSDFRQKGTDWYYYDEDGHMAANVELDINGQHYKFLSSGAAYKGWDITSSGRYYYTSDGSQAVNEGVKIDGYWYYFKEDGQILTGWRQKADGFYYYDENGHMASDKGVKIDGYWYYFTSSGRMLTGWRQKGNDRYYYNSDGHMVTDSTIYIDGYKYYFTSSGKMFTSGWYNGEYYGSDGKQTTPPDQDAAYTIELPGGNTTTVVGRYDAEASQQVFNLLNQYRVEKGLKPLQPANSQLQAAANIRAAELSYLYDHTRPNGQSCFSVYEYSNAENIAYGAGIGYQFSAQQVMNAWKNSPGHNANMLNTASNSVGIAAFKQTVNGITYTYYVQLFSFR